MWGNNKLAITTIAVPTCSTQYSSKTSIINPRQADRQVGSHQKLHHNTVKHQQSAQSRVGSKIADNAYPNRLPSTTTTRQFNIELFTARHFNLAFEGIFRRYYQIEPNTHATYQTEINVDHFFLNQTFHNDVIFQDSIICFSTFI